MEENMTLSAFFKENADAVTITKYVASERFNKVNKDGEKEPIEWELKTLPNNEIDRLRDKYRRTIRDKATREVRKEFDTEGFARELALKTIVYPNLNDGKLQSSYGVVGAEEVLNAMLTPGELTDLLLACQQANDFDSGMAEKIKKVKN